MRISSKGRYALRVMVDLAMHDTGGYIPLTAVSRRQGITIKYLEQIITLLNRAGYLQSARGISGGYRLARAPGEYTVGDVLRATEGSLAPVGCLEPDAAECANRAACSTRKLWIGLDEVVTRYVDGITLQDLIDDYRQSGGDV